MKGKAINRIISFFVSVCIVLASSIYVNPVVVNADNTNVNTSTDPNNGDWSKETLTMTDTNEADVMARTGAIDNFGFGWNKTTTSGYGWNQTTNTTFINPFSGATIGHNFPFPAKQPLTPTGINTIMINSGAYNNLIEKNISNAPVLYANGATDGYSVSFYPNGYTASNYPLSVAQNGSYFGSGLTKNNQAFTSVQPITIDYSSNQSEYNFTDTKANNYKYIRNAVLQLFVDDFQAGPTSAATNPNSSTHRFTGKYHFTINGVEIQELSDEINSLNQSGPVGQLITLSIPTQYLNLLRQNKSIQIKIDDPTTTNVADGYAINFAKLLINDKAIQDAGTVRGTVKNSSGAALKGATVSDSFGDTATTAADGSYTLTNVPAGLGMITAACKNYQTAQQNISVTAGNTTTANFTLQPNTVQQPTITEGSASNSNADTNSPRTITINYADESQVPAGTKVFYQGPNDTVPYWHDYTGAFTVSTDQTIKAYGMNSDDSLQSNITQYDVKDILPEKPILTESSIDGRHKQVTVNFPNSSGLATSDEVINYQGQGDSAPKDHHVTGASATIDVYNNQTISATTSSSFTGYDGSTATITSKKATLNISDVVPDTPTITYADDGAGQEKVTIDFTNTSGTSLSEYDITYTDEKGANGNHIVTGTNMTYPKYTFDINKSQTITAYSKDVNGNKSGTASQVVNVKPPTPIFTEAAATDNSGNKVITIDFGSSSIYNLQNEHVTVAAAGEGIQADHVASVTPNAAGEYIETFEVSKDQVITAYSIDTTNVQGNTGSYEVTDISPGDPVINASPAADGSTHKTVTITYPNSNGGSLIAQNYSISDYGKINIGMPSTAYAGSFTVSKDERINAQSETNYVSSNGNSNNEYSNVVSQDITINPDTPTITQNSSYISPAGSSYKQIKVDFTNNNGEKLTDEYINIITVDPVSGIETPETIHKTSSDSGFEASYTFIVKSSQTITASDKDAVGTTSATASFNFTGKSNVDTPTIQETKDATGTSATAAVTFTSKAVEPTDKVVINIQNSNGSIIYTKTLEGTDISGLTPISTSNGVMTYTYNLTDPAAKITQNGTVITAIAYDSLDNEQSNTASYEVTDINPGDPVINVSPAADGSTHKVVTITYPNANGGNLIAENYSESAYGKANINIISNSYTESFIVSKDERVTAQSETNYTSSDGKVNTQYSKVVYQDILINPDMPSIAEDNSYISPAGSDYKKIDISFKNGNGENLTDQYMNINIVDPVSGIETPETIHKTSSDSSFGSKYSFLVKSSQTIIASDKDDMNMSSATASFNFIGKSNIDTPTIAEAKDSQGTSAQAVVTFTSKSDAPTNRVVINTQNAAGNMNYTKTLTSSDIMSLTPVSTTNGVNTYSYTVSDAAAKITLNGTIVTATSYDDSDNEQSNEATYTVTDILPAAPTISNITLSSDEKTATATITYPNTNGTEIVKELYRIVANPNDTSLSSDPNDASWISYPEAGGGINITQSGYLQAIDVDANGNISAITTSGQIQLNSYVLQTDSNVTYVAPTTGTKSDDAGNTATINYSITDNNVVVASQTNVNSNLQITFTTTDNNIKILDSNGEEVSTITVPAGTPIKIISSTGRAVTTSITASLSDGSHNMTLTPISVQVGNDVSLR